jgi:outer membrane protein
LKKNFVVPALALGAALAIHAQATAPTKIGILHAQEAILSTKEGQKAAGELSTKFAPRKSELEKKQSDIVALQDQLKKGSATMSDDAKNKLVRDIDGKTTALKRDSEDFDSDVQEEEQKLMQELGGKVMKVVEKYATDNGYAVIIDVSNPQTDVLWRAASTDITADIIAMYDKANPSAGGSAPAAPKATTPSAPPAPVRPPSATPGTAPKK